MALSDVDGEPLSLRDSFAAGEEFVDLECPLLLLDPGDTADVQAGFIHCIAVGESAKCGIGFCLLYLGLASQGDTQSIAERHAHQSLSGRGSFMHCDRTSGSFGWQHYPYLAGVCRAGFRSQALGLRRRAGHAFGSLESGELVVPFVEALAAILQSHSRATPMHTATEGPQDDLSNRVAGIESAQSQGSVARTHRRATLAVRRHLNGPSTGLAPATPAFRPPGATQRALREALLTSPSDISSVI